MNDSQSEQNAPIAQVESIDLRGSQGAIVGASGPITQNFGPQYHISGNAYFLTVGSFPDVGEALQAGEKIAAGFASLSKLLERAPSMRQPVMGVRALLQAARDQIRRMTEYKVTHDLLQQLELSYRTLAVAVYENGALLPAQQVSWRVLNSQSNALRSVVEKLCHYVETASFAAAAQIWVADLRGSSDQLRIAAEKRDLVLFDEALQVDDEVIGTQLTRTNAVLIGAVDSLPLDELARAMAGALEEIAPQVQQLGGALSAELGGFSAGIAAMSRHSAQLKSLRLAHDRWQDLDDHLRREQLQLGGQVSRLKRQWERILKPRFQAVIDPAQPWAATMSECATQFETALAGGNRADVETAFDALRSSVITRFGEVDIDLRNVCAKLTEAGGPMDVVLEQLA